MSAQAVAGAAPARGKRPVALQYDPGLLLAAAFLLGLGLVMVTSASISIADRLTGDPLHFFYRQAAYITAGLLLAAVVVRIPLAFWEKVGPILLLLGFVLLVAVLLPGLGRTVKGSTRWLVAGPLNLQVSEMAKLVFVVYLSGYLVRHGDAVRGTVGGFLKPMAVVALLGALLLMEPDFGATVVLTATALGMMFLAGVRLWLFGVLLLITVGAMTLLAVTSPYRMARLTAFTNPWADPFNSGFQLTQALIAFGRGDWFGVGLGASVQKLFYLPEAHTDFLFAVLAEELGLVGAAAVLLLFAWFIWRAFEVGRRAAASGKTFGGHLSYGIAIWLGLQAFINMGVNMGVLPTKGLTLPLMSYGGSSMLTDCLAVALLLRVDRESRVPASKGGAQ